jgi:hypothetical protein
VYQVHPGFFWRAPALAAIARWTGRDQIDPGVLAASVTRHDVIDGLVVTFAPAILAGVIVTPEDFPLGQFDARTRTVDHVG